MKKKIILGVSAAILLLAGVLYLLDTMRLGGIYGKLDLITLQAISDGSITYEARWGRILVSVTDRPGHSHVYLLDHPNVSYRQAVRIVEEKQIQLKTKRTEQSNEPDQ